jgi:hypothetical protein
MTAQPDASALPEMAPPPEAATPPEALAPAETGAPPEAVPAVASPGATASPSRGSGRPLLITLGALVLVLAVVAGLSVWLARPTGPALATDPFAEAVANLATAPAVHYQSSLDNGSTMLDVRVTSYGEMVGTITMDGDTASVLAVGGQTYLKMPDSDLSGLDLPVPDAVLQNKWLTGSEITGDQLLGPVLARLMTPVRLSAKLHAALQQTWDYPATTAPGTTAGGVAALRVTTPIGDLYVTRNAPYRVLRLTPATPSATSRPDLSQLFHLPTTPPGGSTTNPSAPATPGSRTATPLPGRPAAYRVQTPSNADAGDTSFPDMTPDDVDGAYADLESDTKDLAGNSLDADIHFDLTGQAQVACDPGGCTNTANVTTDVTTTGPDSTITSGQVAAELYATNTIDGLPAGACTATATLPLAGASSISCANPGAGPVFSSELAARKSQAQAEAEAEAAASGSASVPYEVDFETETFVTATAQINVQQEIQDEQDHQDAADCQVAAADLGATPNSFLPGTPVLLADGATESIEQVTPGTEVASFDPVTGTRTEEPVLDRIVGSGRKDLDRIDISGGGGAGTVTATANHPFFDPDSRAWVDASALRPGEHLRTAEGGLAQVASVTPYSQSLTVYNLSVAGLHTYYVAAGPVAVVVHNGKKQRFCGLKSGTPKEDWQTKGYHVRMPGDQREVSFYGAPRYNSKNEIVGYDVRVKSTFGTPNKVASAKDLQLAMAELESPAFRRDVLTQGTAGVQYLQQNYPKSGQIQGLEYLVKAVQELG